MQVAKVAVVGLGHNGCAWVRGYQESARAEVVGLCDLWPERLSAASEIAPQARVFSSLDEMLTVVAPEVLSVHTPDHLHAEPFIAGLQAGCHVMVEKPFGNSLQDIERMVEAARRSDRKTQVGHILRFNPLYAELARACGAGELGEIFYMEADYIHNLFGQADPERINAYIGNENWYLRHELPIVGGGVHQLDLLRSFCGSDVVEVDGFGNSIAFPQMEHNDCMVAIFRFAGGACAKVAALYGPVGDRPAFSNLAIYGTRGTFRGGKLMLGQGHDVETRDLADLEIAGHPYDPQIEHFLDCIEQDRPTLVDAFSGANSAVATVCAAEAIAEGQRMTVPVYRR